MVSAAIRHPIRVRLLEALSVRSEISATTFIHQGLGNDACERAVALHAEHSERPCDRGDVALCAKLPLSPIVMRAY